jgi:hypothetical protein
MVYCQGFIPFRVNTGSLLRTTKGLFARLPRASGQLLGSGMLARNKYRGQAPSLSFMLGCAMDLVFC